MTPNHLDHHKDMQEYIDAKRNILLWQTPPCRAVLGFENDITRSMEKDCKGEQVWFTRLHETDNGARSCARATTRSAMPKTAL